METEVGVEGNNDGGMFREDQVARRYSSFSSTKQLTDPVVYKLVRVEGDGRLVPATDDEVIEVEGMLLDGNSEMHIVADTGQAVGCISNDRSSSSMLLQFKATEGPLPSENHKVDPGNFNLQLQETVPPLVSRLSVSDVHKSFKESSNSADKLAEGGSLTSGPSESDLSKLKGEICLDNLSIKQLHEMFKATFGRETTVKDKQWLKRRIAMGLTNSCDVSATTFVISDNKLIKKGKDESCDNVNGAFGYDSNIEANNADVGGSDALEHCGVVSNKRNLSFGETSGSEDHHTEERAAKRVRKPTKRYIEELSEVESKESSGRAKSSVINTRLGQMLSNSHGRAVRTVSLDAGAIITKLDFLGGSDIRIPRVSRVRRSRPRKNFMALLKFSPSGKDMTATLIENAVDEQNLLPDYESGEEVLKASPSPLPEQHQCTGVQDKDRLVPIAGAIHDKVPKQVDSSGDSDDNLVTVPTPKGGIRRKHHRAWTLLEVTKLVEGVSRYGAGRWSEIKRLSFASYTYRTSVDLKDKWRNLLKASFTHMPSDKGVNARKTAGTIPIPEPILSKVRELAKMQSQVPPNSCSSKVTGICLHEKKAGFL